MAPPPLDKNLEKKFEKEKEAIDRAIALQVQNALGSSSNSVPSEISQIVSNKLKALQAEHGNITMHEQFGSLVPTIRNNLEHCIVNRANLQEVKWDDIGGLDEAKTDLKANVLLPLMQPQACQNHSSKILLYGPPGHGKTMLVKALANEIPNVTLFDVKSSDLLDKLLGDSEKNVDALFNMAKQNRPSIIFIDEIDASTSTRKESDSETAHHVKNMFLVKMDGLQSDLKDVHIIGATNMPESIDKGIMRRFNVQIPVQQSDDPEGRKAIFKSILRKYPNEISKEEEFEILASDQVSIGLSGSDINTAVMAAADDPKKEVVKATHFMEVEKDGKKWYTTCNPKTPGAKTMNFVDLPPNSLLIKNKITKIGLLYQLAKMKSQKAEMKNMKNGFIAEMRPDNVLAA